jgi:hypothetical protein
MLFSPFQHLSLFLIRICVALLINCKICFVLPWSTNVPNINRALRGRDRMVVFFSKLPVQSVTICTIVQTCCLFALFYRFVVVYLYCCRNWLFSYCRIDLLVLCYCTDLLLISVAFPTCCLFVLLNKRGISDYQH